MILFAIDNSDLLSVAFSSLDFFTIDILERYSGQICTNDGRNAGICSLFASLGAILESLMNFQNFPRLSKSDNLKYFEWEYLNTE